MKSCKVSHFLALVLSIALSNVAQAKVLVRQCSVSGDTVTVESAGPNAYRIHVTPEGAVQRVNPYYVDAETYTDKTAASVDVDLSNGQISLISERGDTLVKAMAPQLVQEEGSNWSISQTFITPEGDYQYGTGQFQDGYLNIKGLSRRLTQVNTQISVPMILSDRGYGILWNNCGLTDFNPCDNTIVLTEGDASDAVVKVNVTGTEGNRQEERMTKTFVATIDVPVDGEYALLLDCGQAMSRKHYLEVDGKVLTKADNLWLPPTTSVKAHLTKGEHQILVKGDRNDHPTLSWRMDDGTTTFASPVSQGIDYTLFVGSPDEIISQMRDLTGVVPLMPKWAFGYIHCRERFDTQQELLDNAREFRSRNIPVDLIVQDWQWWGNHGWNAMKFDENKYPDPKAMTDSLHAMDMRIMLSVWAKVDKNSELGKEFIEKSYYIPGTDWIDFFNPEAAEGYWTAYRDNLLPTGIDAWWQDATEPENDDLKGRMVNAGKVSGDEVRNIFPIAVNDRVYRGLCESRPNSRPMIMTRSGAPGIQRYGVMTWSGDVGNDWQTLSRQISGGLGQMATGLPWWTYDAGGFFRPGDQYSNEDYQKRMIRWIQNSVFLPFMRVHGYMSQTEPWRYSTDTYDKFVDAIRLRYNLVPYLYSEASEVTRLGSTMMRPLVFDFASDKGALDQSTQYMLGRNLLICPVTTPANVMYVYLPETTGGWYDLYNGNNIAQTGNVKVSLSDDRIPVYVRAGSILPWYEPVDSILSTTDVTNADEITLRVYPGADGEFTLYDDDGVSTDYKRQQYLRTLIVWDDAKRELTINKPKGKYKTPVKTYKIILPDGTTKTVENNFKRQTIKF